LLLVPADRRIITPLYCHLCIPYYFWHSFVKQIDLGKIVALFGSDGVWSDSSSFKLHQSSDVCTYVFIIGRRTVWFTECSGPGLHCCPLYQSTCIAGLSCHTLAIVVGGTWWRCSWFQHNFDVEFWLLSSSIGSSMKWRTSHPKLAADETLPWWWLKSRYTFIATLNRLFLSSRKGFKSYWKAWVKGNDL